MSRPTTDPKIVLLDGLDAGWHPFRQRLAGLDQTEYLWEPVAGMWTIRATEEAGRGTADGLVERDVDPAPVPTIAWRMWHIGRDCLDSYSDRIEQLDDDLDGSWYLKPEEALAHLDRSWERFRLLFESRSTDQLWTTLGEHWGPYANHSLYDLGLHARREVIHHGAEIALLRDLYRASRGASVG